MDENTKILFPLDCLSAPTLLPEQQWVGETLPFSLAPSSLETDHPACSGIGTIVFQTHQCWNLCQKAPYLLPSAFHIDLFCQPSLRILNNRNIYL